MTKDEFSVELIMKWADIYAAQTGEIYSQAAQDPSKAAHMGPVRERLLEVVRATVATRRLIADAGKSE